MNPILILLGFIALYIVASRLASLRRPPQMGFIMPKKTLWQKIKRIWHNRWTGIFSKDFGSVFSRSYSSKFQSSGVWTKRKAKTTIITISNQHDIPRFHRHDHLRSYAQFLHNGFAWWIAWIVLSTNRWQVSQGRYEKWWDELLICNRLIKFSTSGRRSWIPHGSSCYSL